MPRASSALLEHLRRLWKEATGPRAAQMQERAGELLLPLRVMSPTAVSLSGPFISLSNFQADLSFLYLSRVFPAGRPDPGDPAPAFAAPGREIAHHPRPAPPAPVHQPPLLQG